VSLYVSLIRELPDEEKPRERLWSRGAETLRTAELIKSLAGDHTVVVIEHDMEFIRDLGFDVTVLHQGQVLTEGPLDQVKADPRVIEVYLGPPEE